MLPGVVTGAHVHVHLNFRQLLATNGPPYVAQSRYHARTCTSATTTRRRRRSRVHRRDYCAIAHAQSCWRYSELCDTIVPAPFCLQKLGVMFEPT